MRCVRTDCANAEACARAFQITTITPYECLVTNVTDLCLSVIIKCQRIYSYMNYNIYWNLNLRPSLLRINLKGKLHMRAQWTAQLRLPARNKTKYHNICARRNNKYPYRTNIYIVQYSNRGFYYKKKNKYIVFENNKII